MPASRLDKAMITKPMTTMCLCPIISPTRPAIRINVPNVNAYAATVHGRILGSVILKVVAMYSAVGNEVPSADRGSIWTIQIIISTAISRDFDRTCNDSLVESPSPLCDGSGNGVGSACFSGSCPHLHGSRGCFDGISYGSTESSSVITSLCVRFGRLRDRSSWEGCRQRETSEICPSCRP